MGNCVCKSESKNLNEIIRKQLIPFASIELKWKNKAHKDLLERFKSIKARIVKRDKNIILKKLKSLKMLKIFISKYLTEMQEKANMSKSKKAIFIMLKLSKQ